MHFTIFSPSAARGILADAYQRRQPIAIFETTEQPVEHLHQLHSQLPDDVGPNAAHAIQATGMVGVYVSAADFAGCIRVGRIVSCLRSYTAKEFDAFTAGFADKSYKWSSGRKPVPGSPVHVNYFVGLPT